MLFDEGEGSILRKPMQTQNIRPIVPRPPPAKRAQAAAAQVQAVQQAAPVVEQQPVVEAKPQKYFSKQLTIELMDKTGKEIKNRFESIQEMIETLRPKTVKFDNVTLPKEELIRQVSKCVKHGKEKDQLLVELQEDIDKTVKILSNEEENNALRAKIQQIKRQISDEELETQRVADECVQLEEEANQIKEELSEHTNSSWMGASMIKRKFENELDLQRMPIEHSIKELREQLTDLKNQTNILTQQLIQYEQENYDIKTRPICPYVQEDIDGVMKFVKDTGNFLNQDLQGGVNKIIERLMNLGKFYTGTNVQKTVMLAMKKELKRVLPKVANYAPQAPFPEEKEYIKPVVERPAILGPDPNAMPPPQPEEEVPPPPPPEEEVPPPEEEYYDHPPPPPADYEEQTEEYEHPPPPLAQMSSSSGEELPDDNQEEKLATMPPPHYDDDDDDDPLNIT